MSVEPMQGASWPIVLDRIRASVSEQQFQTWFRAIRVESCSEAAIELRVPNSFAGEWLRKRYRGVILRAACEVFGGREPSLAISVEPRPGAARLDERDGFRTGGAHAEVVVQGAAPGASGSRLDRLPGGGGGVLVSPPRPAPSVAAASFPEPLLAPRHTFDRLVETPASRVTLAAARALAAGHGARYSPLLVHGPTGVGKSHLLQAIARVAREAAPPRHVVLVPCEHFVNRFIAAIEAKGLAGFRAHHRGADVLLVDDVHLLAEKERSQAEFLAMVEELRMRNAALVFASALGPGELRERIPNGRLASLLTCGLDGPLGAPLYEGRLQLVHRQAADEGLSIPDEAAQVLAEGATGSVRELQGAVTRFLAHVQLGGARPEPALAERVLGDLRVGSPRMILPAAVLDAVAAQMGVTVGELTGPRRTRRIAGARQVAMQLLRRLTGLSLDEIGRHIGRRDHSTVLHGLERVQERMAREPELRSLVTALEARLKNGR
jgi:chromosomal replication initiator protein